jgi:large subunit ribosomal protein L3
MPFGMIGRKIGMTQVFDKTGNVIPVTVAQLGPCVVVNKLTKDKNGYEAIRVGFEEVSEKKLNKPRQGEFKALKAKPYKILKEFRLDDIASFNEGDVLDVTRFKEDQFVDVIAVSKGKGFQGVQKRHHMSGGPHAHGTHMGRESGSTGMREHPGRVFKNKRMPGRMGREQVTVQNLKVVRVDKENNLLFIKGAVPGVRKGLISVMTAKKRA